MRRLLRILLVVALLAAWTPGVAATPVDPPELEPGEVDPSQPTSSHQPTKHVENLLKDLIGQPTNCVSHKQTDYDVEKQPDPEVRIHPDPGGVLIRIWYEGTRHTFLVSPDCVDTVKPPA